MVFLVYFMAVLIFIDAPIQAEYWVGEMIVAKKELVNRYAGERKLVIAGGSSTLFGIDAEYASNQLGMPVINFGLHAGLRLEKILQEVSTVVEPGDLLVLQLEPPYYDCHNRLNDWQIRNVIAWDHDAWKKMNYSERAEFVTLVSFDMFHKMVDAEYQRKFFPERIGDRIASLDNSLVLSKFRNRTTPLKFEYSAYNLDNYGDMLKTEGSTFKGAGLDPSKLDHICAETRHQLKEFVESMKQKRVSVYFANTPYIASNIGNDEIEKSELSFQQELSAFGRLLDKREDLVFDRKYFFDTNLHLNASGRTIRTKLLINSIRNIVLSGAGEHSHNP